MSLIRWTTFIILFLCLVMNATKQSKWSNSCSLEEDPYRYSGIAVFLFAITLIIAEGFRSRYSDTGNYLGNYKSLTDDLRILLTTSMRPGWDLIQWLLRKINKHPQTIILATAIFITVSDVRFLKKYSTDLPFVFFIYFTTSFISNLNGVRQITAACILMLAFPWVLKQKTIPYLLLIILLSTIHRSVLVVIPLYFVISGKRWNKFLVLFELGCVFSILVPGPINFLIGRFFEDDYASYVIGNNPYRGTASILHVFVDGVPFILGLRYHINNKGNIGENRVYDVLINMQAIKFGFMVLATTMAQYARVGIYMRNSTALLVPFLINNNFRKKDAETIKIIAIVLYFAEYLAGIIHDNSTGYIESMLYLDFSFFGLG